jgi:hypothetical protein
VALPECAQLGTVYGCESVGLLCAVAAQLVCSTNSTAQHLTRYRTASHSVGCVGSK